MAICRRIRLAEHFEEDWEPSWCQGGCDVCSEEKTTEEEDVTEYMKRAVEIINEVG